MSDFEIGEAAWIARLGNLRNAIRQELIGRQVAEHVGDRRSVLDVGCGQGTQALRLLRSGCSVTGIEPSDVLIERFRADAGELGFEPDLRRGAIEDLDRLVGPEVFDIVCAHGLLMYLDDSAAAIRALAQRVDAGGLLSITFKNGHGLAMRPALRGDWAGAVAAFGADRYTNELGVRARSHRLEQVESWLETADLQVQAWYGVRVFNDAISGDVLPPVDGSFTDLLDAEDQAGRTDPYRWLGSQIHMLAGRPASD